VGDDREKELWRQLELRDFLLAGFLVAMFVVAYIGISLWARPGDNLCDILYRFGLDIIANLTPVPLLFIVSYLFLRRVQALRSEQEARQLVSMVAPEVRRLLKDELTAARQQGLVIRSADYGVGDRVEDVTQRIRELVSEEKLEVRAHHDNLGIRDPAEHIKKRLRVVYSYAVHSRTVITDEGDTLSLP
jgi:hypothetical protein